jgi:hypothetical protein
MGVYDDIDTISIQFSNKKIDRIAGDTINLATIFDALQDNILNDAIDNIRKAIIAILEYGCFRTTDTSRIPTLVNNHMPLYFKNKQGLRRGIRDNSKLIQVLKEFNKDAEDDDFVIYVDCDALFLHPEFDEYNLDHISNDSKAFPTSTTPTVSRPTVVLPSSPTTTASGTTSLPPIQLHNLPTSVKERYDNYQAGKLIHYSALAVDFTWEDGTHHRYYENDQVAYQRIFLNTGALFHCPYNPKAFKKDPPICIDESPTGIRRWYDLFRRHCYAYGLYIPPYENIRLGMNHDGLEFGVNIPLHLQEHQDLWRLDLHSVLQKAFTDKSSSNRQRVASTTNGYHALLAVIKPSHPLCHESPSSIIGDPPAQASHEDIPTFWARFHDQGALDAVFLNAKFDPSSKHTVDRFIRKCTHGPYLLKATRDDRNDPSKKQDFEPSSLPLTLESYLARDDSPTKQMPRNPYSKTFDKPFDKRTPRDHFSNRTPRDPFRPFIKKVQELTSSGDTDLPYSGTDLEDVLVTQLQQADQRACLFCGEPHRFDQCHAFGDKKFVENFLIKIVSTVKGKLRDASRLHREHNVSKPQDAQINQLVQKTVDTLTNPKDDTKKPDTPSKPNADIDDITQPNFH